MTYIVTCIMYVTAIDFFLVITGYTVITLVMSVLEIPRRLVYWGLNILIGKSHIYVLHVLCIIVILSQSALISL